MEWIHDHCSFIAIRLFQWLPDKEGLVNGCVVAGFGGGAFIFDQIQTAYINPHNEKANFDENGEKFIRVFVFENVILLTKAN